MSEQDIMKAIEKFIPAELINGSDVKETAEMVDLDVAYKLFLVEYSAKSYPSEEDFELFCNIPDVVLAKKRPDGKYEWHWKTENGPDFRITTANQAKVMRARFLLLKGFYTSNWDKLTLPKQNEVAVKYDIGFIPDILKNL